MSTRWRSSIWRLALVACLPLVLAAMLATQRVTLAQQGAQLSSVYVSGQLPITDPGAKTWNEAPPLDVPLTAQTGVAPALALVTVPTVSVRSLNDGKTIAFRLEWQDKTKDSASNRSNAFRDAAALLFSVDDGVPTICMGTPTQLTDLWHWKADWQEDIDKGFQDVTDAYPNFWRDYYPFAVGTAPFHLAKDFDSAEARSYLVGWTVGNPLSQVLRQTPVEELSAKGFGTATTKAAQTVLGRGEWQYGKWQVVFARAMKAEAPDSAQLAGRTEIPFAIAVWNGANGDVGAKKQLSSFVSVAVQGPGGNAAARPGGAANQTSVGSPSAGSDPLASWAGMLGLVVLFVGTVGYGLRRGEKERG